MRESSIANVRIFRDLTAYESWPPACTLSGRRLWMSVFARFPVTNLYRVEVSGWDKSQTFFVEKSELEWSEESGKQVTLSSAVPDGAVVFLRLIQPLTTDRSQSVPYETEFLSVTPDGQNQFRLHPVSPRVVERSNAN